MPASFWYDESVYLSQMGSNDEAWTRPYAVLSTRPEWVHTRQYASRSTPVRSAIGQAPWIAETMEYSEFYHGSIYLAAGWAGCPEKIVISSSFKLAVGEALDPFDTMYFKVKFGSKEWLHYFEFWGEDSAQREPY